MKQLNKKIVLILVLTAGTVIGIIKGDAARQKWFFKMKNRHEHKRQLAEQKKIQKKGGVALDDIEMASFHK